MGLAPTIPGGENHVYAVMAVVRGKQLMEQRERRIATAIAKAEAQHPPTNVVIPAPAIEPKKLDRIGAHDSWFAVRPGPPR